MVSFLVFATDPMERTLAGLNEGMQEGEGRAEEL